MDITRKGLLTLGLLLLTNPPAPAQGQEDLPKWKIDPYTENDADAYKAAGYVRYDRVMLTPELSKTEVMQALGGDEIEMIWVETEHFIIGSSLPEYKLPGDKIQKTRVAAEVERMRAGLPTLPKKVKKLDPWLRVHLYAQRCEEIYDRVQEILGVTDESFPKGPGERIDGEYRGEGPYLGQRGKFIVLLSKKKSTLHRFANTYCAGNFTADSPIMHNFSRENVMLYGTSPELAEGYFGNDARLHANLAHGLTHAMLNGYKNYLHDMPVWLREGIAHCVVNEVEERYHSFIQIKDQFPNEKKLWIWQPRVRNLVKNEATMPMEKVMGYIHPKDFRIGHHLNIWSRVHYMLETDPERFASFCSEIKKRIKAPGGTVISAEMIAEHQAKAWQRVYDMDPAEFDAAWSEWVLDTYAKK